MSIGLQAYGPTALHTDLQVYRLVERQAAELTGWEKDTHTLTIYRTIFVDYTIIYLLRKGTIARF